MPEIHSRYSPSAASRWLNCPGSLALEQGFPDEPSQYALEGTLAHSFCEIEVKHRFGYVTDEQYKNKLTLLRYRDLYAPEMEHHAKAYCDYIYGIISKRMGETYDIIVEHMIRFDCVAPGGFGTSDCIVVFPNELHVIDFKYGMGVSVSAEDNPQMKLYGFGALLEVKDVLDIETVHMHIFQPRIGNYSDWSISAYDLVDWAYTVVKPAYKLSQSDEPVYNPSQTACRWCKAKNACRARAKWLSAQVESPDLLTNAEIAQLLPRAKELESWAKDLTGEAQHRIENGQDVPGYKIVLGREGARKFTDTDLAFERVKQTGIDEAMLYERKPVTLAALEKIMGKPVFEMAVGDLITRAPGKPTLVPESDKRPAYNSTAAAFGLEV